MKGSHQQDLALQSLSNSDASWGAKRKMLLNGSHLPAHHGNKISPTSDNVVETSIGSKWNLMAVIKLSPLSS